MLRTYMRVLFLLVVIGGCARSPQPLSDAHAAAIRDSAIAFLGTFQALSERAQWDSLSALYSSNPSFRFIENGEVRYRSARAIREALAGLRPGTRIETTYRDVEVDALAPGLASIGALFETAFIDSFGGRFQVRGAVTLVLRHEEPGWRIVAGHSSSPVPRGQ